VRIVVCQTNNMIFGEDWCRRFRGGGGGVTLLCKVTHVGIKKRLSLLVTPETLNLKPYT